MLYVPILLSNLLITPVLLNFARSFSRKKLIINSCWEWWNMFFSNSINCIQFFSLWKTHFIIFKASFCGNDLAEFETTGGISFLYLVFFLSPFLPLVSAPSFFLSRFFSFISSLSFLLFHFFPLLSSLSFLLSPFFFSLGFSSFCYFFLRFLTFFTLVFSLVSRVSPIKFPFFLKFFLPRKEHAHT